MKQLLRVIKIITLLLLMGGFGLFAIKNNVLVTITLEPFAQAFSMPLFVLFLIGVVAGVILSCCFFIGDYVRTSWELKRLRRERKDQILDSSYSQSSYPIEDVKADTEENKE